MLQVKEIQETWEWKKCDENSSFSPRIRFLAKTLEENLNNFLSTLKEHQFVNIYYYIKDNCSENKSCLIIYRKD